MSSTASARRITPPNPSPIYAAGRREITALTLDPSGNLYAAAVGAKTPGSLPPLPVTGAVGITITFVQPGSTTAAGTNGVVPDGSELDRIAADGTPERLLALPNDVVYALALRNGQLLAATGNRGRVYSVDPAVPGRVTEIARLEAGQVTAMAATRAGRPARHQQRRPPRPHQRYPRRQCHLPKRGVRRRPVLALGPHLE